tara:strand:- start:1148 stop:2116 length:969 start_codon:yes stop_codon:yes gene_type:complete
MISFFGDVYLNQQYRLDFDFEDYVFNLEYPLSKKGKPAENKVNLGQDKSYIYETFGKYPLAVCLANNHIMDFGDFGYQKTIDFLEKNKIKYFGAGNKLNNFNNPCILETKEGMIALLGYACETTNSIFGNNLHNGAAKLDVEIIIKDIKHVKEKVDKVILNLHWGDEEIRYPKPSDVAIARALIDNGADLIIGHHAHVIQSSEIYHDKHIFYGLGNFIFPDLNEISFFENRISKGNYIKKQNIQNRTSLEVIIDKEIIKTRTLRLKNNRIFPLKFRIPSWIPKKAKVYNLYYTFWLRYRMLELYFMNPRIPSIRQIKLFLGI